MIYEEQYNELFFNSLKLLLSSHVNEDRPYYWCYVTNKKYDNYSCCVTDTYTYDSQSFQTSSDKALFFYYDETSSTKFTYKSDGKNYSVCKSSNRNNHQVSSVGIFGFTNINSNPSITYDKELGSTVDILKFGTSATTSTTVVESGGESSSSTSSGNTDILLILISAILLLIFLTSFIRSCFFKR